MSIISNWYDFVNNDEYAPYADFLATAVNKFSRIPVREVLDIGCGTGGITYLMAEKGYDMIGLDISPDMLSLAPKHPKVLYICRDACDFELYGSVQLAYSSYDCINYLQSANDLDAAFSNIALYLEKGGLFIFDVNTAYRADHIYDGQTYCYERDDDMLIWRAARNKSRVNFYLTSFTKTKSGYLRDDEAFSERLWSDRTLKKCLAAAGFRIVGVYGSRNFDLPTETDEKAYYIAERI